VLAISPSPVSTQISFPAVGAVAVSAFTVTSLAAFAATVSGSAVFRGEEDGAGTAWLLTPRGLLVLEIDLLPRGSWSQL